MNDKLEKFIRDHRDELDDKLPREDLWEQIQADIQPKRIKPPKNRSLVFWKVAAAVLLLLTSWLAYEKVTKNFQDDSQNDLVAVNDQLAEAETFYTQLISEKKEEVLEKASSFGLDRDFMKELNTLDSMYDVLKKDLEVADQQNVRDAIILNLQLRIRILNEQLKIIQSIENKVKDEKIVL